MTTVSASNTTFSTLEFYPNIETVGVVVSGANLPATAELSYRPSATPDWKSGHPLMRIADGRLVGSLFELEGVLQTGTAAAADLNA
jgi:hypothetical protein